MAVYIKFDGITGESTDDKHKGWSDLTSVSQVIHRSGTGGVGVARNAGTAQLEDIQCSKLLDKASNDIAKELIKGKTFKTVEIDMTTDTAGSGRESYFKYKLENVIVTSYSVSGSPGSRPHESFSLNFTKIEATYQEVKEDGAKGASVPYTWDSQAAKA